MFKDIVKWCEFHKIPYHNVDECHSKQSLVENIKSSKPYLNTEPYLEPNVAVIEMGKKIIDVEMCVITATTPIQWYEQEGLEEYTHLFYFEMWVKGIPPHFVVVNDNQKNLISTKLINILELLITWYPKPYTISLLSQWQGIYANLQCCLPYHLKPFKDEVMCDVAPLKFCDVLLRYPYMWRHHIIYES